ncbi:MAG TPA: hypothetical protein PKH07_10150 [bacterium]|nr:hypothetical protein [bacterium]
MNNQATALVEPGSSAEIRATHAIWFNRSPNDDMDCPSQRQRKLRSRNKSFIRFSLSAYCDDFPLPVKDSDAPDAAEHMMFTVRCDHGARHLLSQRGILPFTVDKIGCQGTIRMMVEI